MAAVRLGVHVHIRGLHTLGFRPFQKGLDLLASAPPTRYSIFPTLSPFIRPQRASFAPSPSPNSARLLTTVLLRSQRSPQRISAPNRSAVATCTTVVWRAPQSLCLRRYNHGGLGGKGPWKPGRDFEYLERRLARNMFWTTKLAAAIIAANAVVFFAWQIYGRSDEKSFEFMVRNFTMKLSDLREGRWWTIILSNFSHKDVGHIVFNMVTFYTLAEIAASLGISPFVQFGSLILGSALMSSWAFMTDNKRKLHGENVNGLGASGIVSGMAVAMAFLVPRYPLLVFGIVPAKLWQVAALYIGVDMVMLENPSSNVGHSAHLGGAAFGLFWWLMFRRKIGR